MTAFEWLKALDSSTDGRLAMDVLRAHFEDSDTIAMNEVQANNILENFYYKDEKMFSFEKYTIQLKKAYTVLSHG